VFPQDASVQSGQITVSAVIEGADQPFGDDADYLAQPRLDFLLKDNQNELSLDDFKLFLMLRRGNS